MVQATDEQLGQQQIELAENQKHRGKVSGEPDGTRPRCIAKVGGCLSSIYVVIFRQWLHEEVLNTTDSQKVTTLATIKKVRGRHMQFCDIVLLVPLLY